MSTTPLNPDPLGQAVIGLFSVLVGLSTIAVGLRMWVRCWYMRTSRTWGWDDLLLICSYVSFIPSATYGIKAAMTGLGSWDSTLEATGDFKALHAQTALYMGWWEIPYAVSVNLCKAAVAVTLMRITQDKRYLWTLWGILIAEILITVVCLITLFAICHPAGAQWDDSLGYCASYEAIPILSYPFTVVNIVTDWSCAIIPSLLIRNLKIPPREKVSIGVLLALGALASVGSIGRAPYIRYYFITADRLYYFGYIVIWSTIENGLAIFAAALPPVGKLLPCLKGTTMSSSDASRHAVHTIGGTPLASFKRTEAQSQFDSPNDGPWTHLEDNNSSQELQPPGVEIGPNKV